MYQNYIVRKNKEKKLHRIIGVETNCICPKPFEFSPSETHLHLHCVEVESNEKSYFHGYVFNSIKGIFESVWDENILTIVEAPERVQLSIFDKF